jgi:hypothetical protein
MSHIYKVATFNTNGIASRTLLGTLEEFLWKQDIDLALLQVVTNPHIFRIHKLTDGRVTAILTKEGQTISEIKRLRSGRGIAAMFNRT